MAPLNGGFVSDVQRALVRELDIMDHTDSKHPEHRFGDNGKYAVNIPSTDTPSLVVRVPFLDRPTQGCGHACTDTLHFAQLFGFCSKRSFHASEMIQQTFGPSWSHPRQPLEDS